LIQYDAILKNMLQRLSAGMLKQITGFTVARWLNVELPDIRSLRVDLLGETAENGLVHIELQSTNDSDMALRMAEYSLAIRRRFARNPAQLVLYVGEAPMRMKTEFTGPHLSFACEALDVRDLDCENWLSSNLIEDNILAILLRFGTEPQTLRRILEKISAADPELHHDAVADLITLARLRKVSDILNQEVQQMAIKYEDYVITEEEFLEVYEPFLRITRQIERSVAHGAAKGKRDALLLQLAERFGPVPQWARERLETMSPPEMDSTFVRLLTAPSLEDLLPRGN
jgi:hypothetical protein